MKFIESLGHFLDGLISSSFHDDSNSTIDVSSDEKKEEEISLTQRTLVTRLYAMEQQIEIFKNEFQKEYCDFQNQIGNLREKYYGALEEIKKKMTFEIDPEFNSQMIADIQRLEKSIQKFIDNEVKFYILSKRLQNLIVKLNILYNVSISHPQEKRKILSQLGRALTIEMEMAQEFKESEVLLSDGRKRDWIVTLISYADYEIFKGALRNSEFLPEEVWKKLALLVKFQNFDGIAAFKSFLEDELSDYAEWIPLICEEEYRKIFSKKITSLQTEIVYNMSKEKILDLDFWKKIFELESSLIEFLKRKKISNPKDIKIGLIKSMKIDIKESDVLILPKTNAYLSVLNVFSSVQEDNIWILIKLFPNLSNEVTYREIYFLLVLFEAMDIMKTVPNSLNRYMKRYVEKYPYDIKTIKKRKAYVLHSSTEKEYIKLFPVEEDFERITLALKKLQLDYEIIDDSIALNTFYFQGMKHLFLSSLA